MPDKLSENLRAGQSDWLPLAALFTSVFAFCVAFGGLTPLIALTLEARGVDAALIGLVVAAQPIGTIIAAPLAPRLLRRFGTVDTILLCDAVSILSLILLPVFMSAPAWFVLRLIAGLAGAGPWIVTETWINAVASSGGRGRVVALYGSVMALGFVVGPLLLTLLGSEGPLPFVAFTLLYALAVLPILLMRGRAPKLDVAHKTRYAGILLAAPALFAAAVLAGVVDIAFFSFLPIWGLRNGLEESFTVLLLTVFVSGNIVLQFPLGWLADTIGYRRAMFLCGLVCLIGPGLAPQVLAMPWMLAAVLFVWGGAAWGIYSIALAALGLRFRGALLAAANAVFVIAYEIANIVGPPAAGAAVDLWPQHGLMAVMAGAAGLFVLIVLSRLGRPLTLKE
ncbi:MAG: MFS transporter [Kiloniellaceae bacterium]